VDWTGNFYPKDARPESFLSEYAKHFHTVEVDNTFYRIPNKDTVVKWRDQTPPEFLFSAKFPKRITHEKMLKDFYIVNCLGLENSAPASIFFSIFKIMIVSFYFP
jgi:uncharacterized protein YecE (DUF72 family)